MRLIAQRTHEPCVPTKLRKSAFWHTLYNKYKGCIYYFHLAVPYKEKHWIKVNLKSNAFV